MTDWFSLDCFTFLHDPVCQLSHVSHIGIRLSRETMEIAPWKSVCGGTAAPSVAVEPDPRAAGPVAVAAREDGVVRRR